MYEVVMGIPKSEGMQPPPRIPANPSFVELQEDENAVEKFKTAMTSITSILSLDRMKQVRILSQDTSSVTSILSLDRMKNVRILVRGDILAQDTSKNTSSRYHYRIITQDTRIS